VDMNAITGAVSKAVQVVDPALAAPPPSIAVIAAPPASIPIKTTIRSPERPNDSK
jgi:hypothetical protein